MHSTPTESHKWSALHAGQAVHRGDSSMECKEAEEEQINVEDMNVDSSDLSKDAEISRLKNTLKDLPAFNFPMGCPVHNHNTNTPQSSPASQRRFFPTDNSLSSISADKERSSLEEEENYTLVRYALYAIVVHSGHNSRAGHYYCYSRSSTDAVRAALNDVRVGSSWKDVNDSSVQSTTLFQIRANLYSSNTATPYLMFYQKIKEGTQMAPTAAQENFQDLPAHLQEAVRAHLFRAAGNVASVPQSSQDPPAPSGGCGAPGLDIPTRFVC